MKRPPTEAAIRERLSMPHWLVVVLLFLFVAASMATALRFRKQAVSDKDDSGVWTGGDGLHHPSDDQS